MSGPEAPSVFRKEALVLFARSNSCEFKELLLHPTKTLREQQQGLTSGWIRFIDQAIGGRHVGEQADTLDAILSYTVVTEVQQHRKSRGESVPETAGLLYAALCVFWSSLPEEAQNAMQLKYSHAPTEIPSQEDRRQIAAFVLSCVGQTLAPHNFGSPLVTNTCGSHRNG